MLSMRKNDFGDRIIAERDGSGKLTITHVDTTDLTKDDWDEVLNLPTYRLNNGVTYIDVMFIIRFKFATQIGFVARRSS